MFQKELNFLETVIADDDAYVYHFGLLSYVHKMCMETH